MNSVILIFLIYSVFGTLLHFTYKLSNNNIVVGMFSAINESVWEHIKILCTPIFVVNLVLYIMGYRDNYFFILFTQLFMSAVLIIAFYLIKTKLFGDDYGFINVICFYIVAFIVSFMAYSLRNVYIPDFVNVLSIIGTLIIFIMYLTFSIFPLKNKFFLDPVTKTYGINNSVKKSV